MTCHSLTNFAVDRNHVSTVVSEVEILSSFARHLCSTAQNFVHSSEPSFQRSEQSVFVNILGITKLHRQGSIHHWQYDRIFHLMVLLDQSSMWMCPLQLLCPSSSSPIRTASDYWWHWHRSLQLKMRLQKCRTFVSNLRAIQQNSSHRSNRHNSNHRSKKDQWYRRMQIPKVLNLSPILNFQDLRDQLSMFCLWVRLWHLGSHFWFFGFFLWTIPCFPYYHLCLSVRAHSWTMTWSVCFCHTMALQSRWKCAPPHLKHPSRGLDNPFPLPDARESWLHQHPWDPSLPECSCRSASNHEFSNRTSPPRTSRLPGAHPRMLACGSSWGQRMPPSSSNCWKSSSRPNSAATCARRLNSSWSWVTTCSMVIDIAHPQDEVPQVLFLRVTAQRTTTVHQTPWSTKRLHS